MRGMGWEGVLHTNGKSIMPLNEIPGLHIIGLVKAGDGYLKYEKLATHTEDMMHGMSILELDIQQLHQYDWSSGHKKGLEGELKSSGIIFWFGGNGEEEL